MGKFNAEFYHFEKQPFFSNDLKIVTTNSIIEEYRDILHFNNLPDNPPFKLMLVETPLSITSFFRPWKKSSDFAQPEIFFWPERGATF